MNFDDEQAESFAARQLCEKSKDDSGHCNCWWNERVCCWCGAQ